MRLHSPFSRYSSAVQAGVVRLGAPPRVGRYGVNLKGAKTPSLFFAPAFQVALSPGRQR